MAAPCRRSDLLPLPTRLSREAKARRKDVGPMVEHLAALSVGESPREPEAVRNAVVLVVDLFDRDPRSTAPLNGLAAPTRQAHVRERAHLALRPDAQRKLRFLITGESAEPRVVDPA